jgi:hypothetical protein
MHFKKTQGRSLRAFKIRAMAIIAVVFMLWASPFVFSSDSGNISLKENSTLAYDFKTSLTKLAGSAGLTTKSGAEAVDLPVFIGRLIYYALGFIGIVFLILAILAGIKWMMAGGNEETVVKARSSILNAGLGALVALSAYAISYFIVNVIVR